jgi:malonyl-CoA O-methyltransferase
VPEREIDVAAARRRFQRSAATYGEASVLAREVERRMHERLQYIRHAPGRVLDAGCGPGEGLGLLRKRFPEADLVGLDIAPAMAQTARRARTLAARARQLFRGAGCSHVCADVAHLPLASGSIGMLWSNLALAWAADARTALAEFGRVLEPQGLLMFSTYGPDTLKELRSAFGKVDGYAHVHRFIDMHDLGDMLTAAGFADPVMDMEFLTLSYTDVAALARDLRLSGQSNVHPARRHGLMAPAAWSGMEAAYELLRLEGRLPATFEIVYGHAWKGIARPRRDDTQVVKVPFPSKKPK